MQMINQQLARQWWFTTLELLKTEMSSILAEIEARYANFSDVFLQFRVAVCFCARSRSSDQGVGRRSRANGKRTTCKTDLLSWLRVRRTWIPTCHPSKFDAHLRRRTHRLPNSCLIAIFTLNTSHVFLLTCQKCSSKKALKSRKISVKHFI